ncbi:MAG: DegT/DnrJ/EryC1/StrS family aminotransferase [Treponema sp.]|nr:DegT/DnrJ/EryC1/StrS family aminotransferase [Treponema sp.]
MKIEIYSPTIRRKEMDAVLTAMVEEKIGPGDRSRLLIQTAKEQIGFDYALALRSPAVALHFALKALNVKPGQAVIISALSPRYYLQVLQDLQLTPLFCDVTYDFPCLNRDLIENIISKNSQGYEIAAIVLHHTLGFIPDTASISELGIPVIEDISQSYGSTYESYGVFCILGLEERDMLTAGGGALLFSMTKKDSTALRGFAGAANEYFLPDINAALAVVQFKEQQRNTERRRDIVKIYINACLSLATRTKHKRFIPVNNTEDNCNYSFSLVLETGLKDVITYAKKKEIEIENAFENTIAGAGGCSDCPVSSSLVLRTIQFPMYPRLRSQDVERISRLIMTLP